MESNRMNRRVYLDHNASTPIHPEVLAEMLPYFSEVFGNPSSIHTFGRDAREGVERARERVARFLGVSPQEVVFTSGGTESDNFGVKGLAYGRGKGHLITSSVEHHAVLRACQALEAQGFDVTYVGVDEYGIVDPDDVRRAIRPDTIAISIMHANIEVGSLQPITAIGRIAREHGVPLHVDAVQTLARSPSTSTPSGSTRCPSRATRSTDPRASPASGSARALAWSRSSTAASTSGGAGRARRTYRVSSASARQRRYGAAICTRR